MKMTFALPEELARRFQAAYPKKQHFRIVTALLAKKLRLDEHQLAQACRGANNLRQVAKDMEDWEKLNGYLVQK